MKLLAVILCALLLSACSHAVYPILSGSHSPNEAFAKTRYVVWSNHPQTGQYLTGVLLQNGHTVVERVRLEQIFAEQRMILSHARPAEADILKVGQLVGAAQVLFVDVGSFERERGWFSAPPPVRVTVRAVDIQSGEVRWAGTASYPEATLNPDHGAMMLAHWAILKATCRTELGAVWEEPRVGKGGCVSGQAGAVSAKVDAQPTEPGIWKEMKGMERGR